MKIEKNCATFLLLQAACLVASIAAQTEEDNKSELPTVSSSTASASRTIEIVFLHEVHQSEFLSAVDEIMKELKLQGIGINYQQIAYDRKNVSGLQSLICELGEKGFSIFIDSTLSGYYPVRDMLKQHRIPYFNFDYSVQSFVKLMELYLIERKASDAIFILQDETATKEAFYNFCSQSALRVMLLDQLTPKVVERLKNLRPTPNFFVIIANTDNMERIFRNAHDAGLVSRLPERWNLMFTDYGAESFKQHLDYPEMSRLLLNKTVCCNPECICTSRELKFEALRSFLHQMVDVFEANDFIVPKLECNKDPDEASPHREKLLSDLLAMVKSNGLIYVDDDLKLWQNLNFEVWTSVGNSKAIETTALVGRNGVATVGNHTVKPANRFLRIGVTESMPYTYYKRDPKTNEILRNEYNKPIYEGFCIDFIIELSRRMNFTYELVEPSTGKFGKRTKDKSYDGLVGDLQRGETEIIVAALKMTAEREELIDFVAPYFDQTGILIVMKKPVPDTSLFKFMTVLRLEVWLSILGALSVTAGVIWFLEIFSPYSGRNWNYAEPCRKFTLRESVWFSLCSFTPQGGGEAPKALSGRIIVAAYWLFVVLMLATFTANLAAFLTVERMQSPVQSLDQLSRQSRINYTVVEGSDTHQYFKNMKHAEDKLYELWKQTTLSSTSDDTQYRIWDYPIKEQYASILMSIEGTRTLANATEGFRIVNKRETNDFAFIHDANEIKYEISRNCNYSIVGDIFAEQPYAVAVQQGSHLQDEISRMILELQKDRFFEELTARYWNTSTNKGSCIRNDDSEGITLESLGGVFIATLVGLAIALLVLVGEVYYYKRKSKKENAVSASKTTLFTKNIAPFNNFEYSEKVVKNSILLGNSDQFIPADKTKRLSFISVYPRD